MSQNSSSTGRLAQNFKAYFWSQIHLLDDVFKECTETKNGLWMRRYLVEPEEKPEYFQKSWWSKKLGGAGRKTLESFKNLPPTQFYNRIISFHFIIFCSDQLYKEAFAINFLFQQFRVCLQIILGLTEQNGIKLGSRFDRNVFFCDSTF